MRDPVREAVQVPLPAGAPNWRTLLRMLGPAYLVAVGYMDPGNWAGELAPAPVAARADSVIIGVDSILGNCFPFSRYAYVGNSNYQQAYNSEAFPKMPIVIESFDLFIDF